MIRNGLLTVIILILSINNLSACIDERASFSAGILFNNDEGIHFDKITTMGSNSKNFTENCIDYSIPEIANQITLYPYTDGPAISKDPVSVKSIFIGGGFLRLGLEYSGGCNEHYFTLYAEDTLSDSPLPALSMILSHDAKNDNCEALISETVFFSLSNILPIANGHQPVKLIVKYPSTDPAVFQTRTIIWYPYMDCSFEYYRDNSKSHTYLVSLEYFKDEYTNELFPSMRILINPTIMSAVPINRGQIVKSELEWLISKGIVTGIKSSTLDKIASDIGTKSIQYWTFQDSAIYYNQFFEYTIDSEGKYLWTRNTVSSRLNNCSSSYVFNPSTDPIDTSATSVIKKINSLKNEIMSVSVNDQSCKVFLNNVTSTESIFSIIDCKGRTVDRIKISSGKKEFTFGLRQSFADGMYYAVYQTGSKILGKCKFIKY